MRFLKSAENRKSLGFEIVLNPTEDQLNSNRLLEPIKKELMPGQHLLNVRLSQWLLKISLNERVAHFFALLHFPV